MNPICNYCSIESKLVSGSEIYPHRPDLYKLKFYLCKDCDAYVGCHKGGNGDKPLGRLANKELRTLKSKAHKSFDPIWKSGKMKRTNAYKWLSKSLNISYDKCHIGMFNENQCINVINVCESFDLNHTQGN